MTEAWYSEAIRLLKRYAECKGSLDVAHVMGDSRFYQNELPDEKSSWEALKKHLRMAVTDKS